MHRQVRVLHVDDDPEFAEVAATFLERVGDGFSVETAANVSEGLARLAEASFDCVVSDYDMPETNGIEFLEAVRAEYPDLPFVLFTGKGSEEVASEAVSKGVSDYLQKGRGTERYTLLANRIQNLVAQHRAEAGLESRIEQQSVLAALGESALSGCGLQTLFEETVALVSDALGTEYSKVLEYRSDSDDFLLQAGVGWQDGLVGNAAVGADEESQAGHTLQVGGPVVVEDLRTEDRFRGPPLLLDHGVVSGISVVIGETDDPWGVFGTHSTDQITFTDDDVTFVQNVANLLGTAIQRQRSEQRRRESERRFREIAEVSPDTIFRLDTDGVFTYVSPVIESLLGYAPEDLVDTPFQTYVPDESMETAFDGFSRVAAGETVREFELRLIDADGDLIDVEVSASPVTHDGSVRFVQGLVRDVTERTKRERRLQRLKAQYETLIENLPEMGVFLFDRDCRYTVAGGGELSSVGLTSADFEGATAHDLFPEAIADELEHYYREALDGRSHRFEQQYQDRQYQVQTLPVRDDDGEVISGLAVSEDITERRERQQALERQNERLREFAGVVSHDLRNPLNVAQGRLELARTESDSDHLDDVAAAIERSHRLIDDLLTLASSGDEVTETEALDLGALTEGCWRNVPTGDATLSVRTEQTVVADRSRLEQLLENLARNAVEHARPQSAMSSDDTDGNANDLTVTVGALAGGFYVEDTGPGIPPEERDEVFEAGHSTAVNGTGFGLRIVEQIADAHGWTVTVTDSESGGARFEFHGVETA
ncbi:PAS domain S-box protein [Haloarcula marismortui]|uniref:PAS domain S-box protein n=1 Tax=Haloarcula marismortui TaxID=2238 RepID=UPI003C771D93